MSTKVFCPSCGVDFLATTAARTGGICMRCLQEGPPQPSKIVKKARKKPARCVASFALESFLPDGRENRESLHSAFFRIACPCGGAKFSVLGFREMSVPGKIIFIPPLDLACKQCANTKPLFDPKKDGYDGENDPSTTAAWPGLAVAHLCTKCHQPQVTVSISLEYSLDDDELEDCKEMKRRPQDFFTSINLYTTCAHCEHRDHVISYECA